MRRANSIKKGVDPSRSIHRYAGIGFLVFFILVLWGFWPTYFSILGQSMETHKHLHGLGMTLWCVMLITQAFLIRWKKKSVHKLLGKISYVLVPYILVSGLHIAQLTLKDIGPPGDIYRNYFSALMFNALLVFAIFYGLAIWHRKTAALHSRWMICTVFPILTPATDRIIHHHFESLVQWAPGLQGMPMVQVYGFGLADLILTFLAICDGVVYKRYQVFPWALGVLLLYHLSVIVFQSAPILQQMAAWMMAIPVS